MVDLDRLCPYRPLSTEQVRVVGQQDEDGLSHATIVYPGLFGGLRAAALLRPAGGAGPFPAILYVHWYEPQACDSNRTQFEAEAREMARRGAVCLLVETMWSDRDWFLKRSQAEDYDNSLRQVSELRQAMGLLLAQPGVDRGRLVYVGHDFGGMYGVLAGAAGQQGGPRPTCYVIMAATPRFPEWYLYLPRLDDAARERFIARMAPLDPIAHVAALPPAPILFQFATDDRHVPRARAEAFFAAARAPKELRWYEAGHGLNEVATAERVAWLEAQM